MNTVLALLLGTIVAAWLAIALAMRHAVGVGLIDHPRAHKTHAHPVPLVGGFGIAAGLVCGWLWLGPRFEHSWLAAAAALVLATGVADDRHTLSPRLRLALQAAAAAMLAVGGVRLVDFGALLAAESTLALGWAALPITLFCLVGVMNAINMIDGSDGVAGTVVAIALIGMLVLARGAAHPAALLLAVALAATLVFLRFNLSFGMRRARVFLGNGGSLLLGLVVGAFAVGLSQGETRAFAPVTALWLLGVPLIDTVSLMLRRWRRGGSALVPDHEHVHHLLRRAGLSASATLGVIALVSVVIVLIGALGEYFALAEWLRFAAFLALAFAWHGCAIAWSARLPPLAGARA
jgi:UDP-GlcNAc:undecaprenyl-phosphate GlcNAc-1-phosphate transferase